MDISKCKEDISISYISALCAYAGIAYDIQRHDEDSTDGIIKKTIDLDGNTKYGAECRIQLKCTSSSTQYIENGGSITYKLKAKNYNDLCRKCTTPVILALLILPDDFNCLSWTEKELMIKGRMYWASFCGKESTNNSATINVPLDKKNVISDVTLQKILEKIAREGEL